MTATDPDTERGLYGKYVVWKPDPETGELRDPGPVFVLNYTKDPHARVALEAYADSCQSEYPQLAADLYAQLGIDSANDNSETITPELKERLERGYQGQWVAISSGEIVAFSATLKTLQATLAERCPSLAVTVFRVPMEGEPQHG